MVKNFVAYIMYLMKIFIYFLL